MTPFIAQYLPDEDIQIFERVRVVVNTLPDDLDLGEFEPGKPMKITCHILAEAVAKSFGLERISGYFEPCMEHSWTLTRSSNIIDVYPVAIFGGPILVVGKSLTGRFYKKEKIRPDIFESPHFKIAVEKVVEELNKLKKPAT